MKETNTIIFEQPSRDDEGRTEADSGTDSRTKVWCVVCDTVTLLLAFMSISALTVVTIVLVVSAMAHTQMVPPSDTLLGELSPRFRQSGSRIDHWVNPDRYTLAPASPGSTRDEHSMFLYDQDIEPELSW